MSFFSNGQFHVTLINYGGMLIRGRSVLVGELSNLFFFSSQRYSLTDQRSKRDETSEPLSLSGSGIENG